MTDKILKRVWVSDMGLWSIPAQYNVVLEYSDGSTEDNVTLTAIEILEKYKGKMSKKALNRFRKDLDDVTIISRAHTEKSPFAGFI